MSWVDEERECASVTCENVFTPRAFNHKFCCPGCRKSEEERGDFIILERDGFRCFYCSSCSYLHGTELLVDHVVPIDKGGVSRAWNLVAACVECNLSKGGKIIRTDGLDGMLREIDRRNKKEGIPENAPIKLRGDRSPRRAGVLRVNEDALPDLLS